MDAYELSGRLLGFNLHKHTYHHLKDHFVPHEGNGHRPHVLGHRVLFLYSVMLVLVKVSVLSLPLLLPGSAAQSLSITPSNITELTNTARSDFGLEPLVENPKLSVAAMNKARNMMEEGYFGHYSPNGVSPWYWISQAGYEYDVAGENLAMRFSTAEGVNSAWLASAAHKANILSPDFTEIGVAVVTDEFQDEGVVTLVVQMFGTKEGTHVAVGLAGLQLTETPRPPSLTVGQSGLAETTPDLELIFPQEGSFLKVDSFAVIGNAPDSGEVSVFIDGAAITDAVKISPGEFHLIAEVPNLSDGQHIIRLEMTTPNGKKISSLPFNFSLDTHPPVIYEEGFLITRALGQDDAYEVRAEVSEDSIRTIASIGKNSGVLNRLESTVWRGEVPAADLRINESVPVEIFAQDLAGNESKKRIGELRLGQVAGVFSFISDAKSSNEKLFGGLISFNNLSQFAGRFYLYFIAFLASALILKIGIKRHIQHPQTIAASAFVLMLASILFAI